MGRRGGFGLVLLLALLGACGAGGGSVAPSPDAVANADDVCGDPARGPRVEPFTDVTQSSGLAFVYVSPDVQGGALLAADLDGDGLPEVIAGNRNGGVAVFHNLGGMRFEPVTSSGIDLTIALGAAAAADLDNDGDLDLVLAGGGTAYVMANRGDGTFVQVAQFDDVGATEQVLPVDLDGDGRLDLFFANRNFPIGQATQNRLFMNRGGLQFELAGTVNPVGLTWTATAFDYDGDGAQDLYIANDTLIPDFGPGGLQEPTDLQPDSLLQNGGRGSSVMPRFTDQAAQAGLARPTSSMGGVLGDLDGDGRLDLYVTNLGANKAFVRTADGYVDQALALGIDATYHNNGICGPGTTHEDCLIMSWSAAYTDLDLDGYDELLVVNGMTGDRGIQAPVILFERGADPAFHEVSPDIGCLDARGLVVTDLDGDGDQDVLIAQHIGALTVLQNRTTPAPGTWLDVRLVGTASNRDGVGAVVTAHLASGRQLVRAVGAGGVINAWSPAEAFFGLGQDPVVTLDILWPSGLHSQLIGPLAGVVRVVETRPAPVLPR